MRLSRLERWLAVALAVQLLVGLVWLTTYRGLFDPRGMPLGNDFAAFWFAARLATRQPAVDAYDLLVMTRFQHGIWPDLVGMYAWVYPPSFLLLVLALGSMSYLTGYVVWTVTTLGLFLAGLWVSFRTRASWWLVAAFPGVWLGLGQGQNQFLTAGLAALGLGLLRRHPVWAGVCIGLLAVKPHLALLFPVALLAARAWRAIWAAAVTAVTVTLLPAAVLGWGTIPAWLGSMAWVSTAIAEHHLPVWMFPAPYPWLVSLGIPAAVAAVLQAAVSVLAAVAVYRLWRPMAASPTASVALPATGLVLATFLATPYYAMYDLAWLALPLCWLLAAGTESGWRRGERPLLVGLFLLPYASVLALVVDVQVAPFVLAALLWHVVQRAVSDRSGAPVGRTPAVL